ncbi:hypothetical protein E4U55_007853 [Claviceps digitariae]|nr:hypothetical protein E4U55_007853 [Claviceps digitariae]
MDDENLIARVYAHRGHGFHKYAKKAIKASPYCVAPSSEKVETESPDEQPDEQPDEPPDGDAASYNREPCIEIRLDKIPRSNHGITFGCSAKCDVILPNFPGISNRHFSLTFDDEGRLIARDMGSESGTIITIITYDGKVTDSRRNFSWIVQPPSCVKVAKVIISPHRKVQFRVICVGKAHRSPAYLDKVNNFRQGSTTEENIFDDLCLDVPRTKPASETGTASPGPLCLDQVIGKGGFGVAKLRWNFGDGSLIVVKEPTEEAVKAYSNDREELVQLWRKEADIMKKLHHKNILKLITATFDPWPQLQLEYMPYGSLQDLQKLTVLETKDVAIQSLSALVYLHGKGLADRDISPRNILVKTRNPLCIVLADFGLSKDAMELETMGCGTRIYTAPEVHAYDEAKKYTAAVDIWSLGVVIAELLGLKPSTSLYRKFRQQGPDHHWFWCNAVVDAVLKSYYRHLDKFRGFLFNRMLRMLPEYRSTAQECLTHISTLPDTIATQPSSDESDPDDVLWREYSVNLVDNKRFSDYTTEPDMEPDMESTIRLVRASLANAEASAIDNKEPAESGRVKSSLSSQRTIRRSAAPLLSERPSESTESGLKRRIADTDPENPTSKRRGRVSISVVEVCPDT